MTLNKISTDQLKTLKGGAVLDALISQEYDVNEVLSWIAEGINTEVIDEVGGTPLIHAAHKGEVGIVKALLDAGANINVQDDDGTTPVMTAVAAFETSVLKELIKHGADLELRDNLKRTAFLEAADKGSRECIDILLDAGADYLKKDMWDKTAEDIAQEEGYIDLALYIKKIPEMMAERRKKQITDAVAKGTTHKIPVKKFKGFKK